MKKTLIIVGLITLCTIAGVWSQQAYETHVIGPTTSSSYSFSCGSGPGCGIKITGFPEPTCPVSAISMKTSGISLLTNIEELGLSIDQLKQITDVLGSYSDTDETMKALKENAGEESKSLCDMLMSNATREQIRIQASRAHQAEKVLLDAEIEKWMQVRSLLTDEQLVKLYEIYANDDDSIISFPKSKTE